MSYVIYNKKTTVILKAPARSVRCYITSYKSEGAAKAALTRMTKAGKLEKGCTKDDYAIADAAEFYSNIEKKVTLTVMGTDKEFEVGVNTDYQTTAASEHYWSN